MRKDQEPPQAIIWADGSEESKEAIRLLEEAEIRFEERMFGPKNGRKI